MGATTDTNIREGKGCAVLTGEDESVALGTYIGKVHGKRYIGAQLTRESWVERPVKHRPLVIVGDSGETTVLYYAFFAAVNSDKLKQTQNADPYLEEDDIRGLAVASAKAGVKVSVHLAEADSGSVEIDEQGLLIPEAGIAESSGPPGLSPGLGPQIPHVPVSAAGQQVPYAAQGGQQTPFPGSPFPPMQTSIHPSADPNGMQLMMMMMQQQFQAQRDFQERMMEQFMQSQGGGHRDRRGYRDRDEDKGRGKHGRGGRWAARDFSHEYNDFDDHDRETTWDKAPLTRDDVGVMAKAMGDELSQIILSHRKEVPRLIAMGNTNKDGGAPPAFTSGREAAGLLTSARVHALQGRKAKGDAVGMSTLFVSQLEGQTLPEAAEGEERKRLAKLPAYEKLHWSVGSIDSYPDAQNWALGIDVDLQAWCGGVTSDFIPIGAEVKIVLDLLSKQPQDVKDLASARKLTDRYPQNCRMTTLFSLIETARPGHLCGQKRRQAAWLTYSARKGALLQDAIEELEIVASEAGVLLGKEKLDGTEKSEAELYDEMLLIIAKLGLKHNVVRAALQYKFNLCGVNDEFLTWETLQEYGEYLRRDYAAAVMTHAGSPIKVVVGDDTQPYPRLEKTTKARINSVSEKGGGVVGDGEGDQQQQAAGNQLALGDGGDADVDADADVHAVGTGNKFKGGVRAAGTGNSGGGIKDLSNVVCMRCLDKGHLASTCTKPPKCWRCGSERHSVRDCPEKKGTGRYEHVTKFFGRGFGKKKDAGGSNKQGKSQTRVMCMEVEQEGTVFSFAVEAEVSEDEEEGEKTG